MPVSGFQTVFEGSVPVGGIVSIGTDATLPSAVYLVNYGTWNFHALFVVMVTNGGTPATARLLQSGSVGYNLAANGSWGFDIVNTAAYAMPCRVLRIM